MDIFTANCLKEDCLKNLYSNMDALLPHDKYYEEVFADRKAAYFITKIDDILKKNNENIIVGLRSKSDILGVILLEYLPWDTKIYKLNISRISYLLTSDKDKNESLIKRKLIRATLNECRKRKYKLVSIRIDSDDSVGIHLLEEFGFKLMDVTVTLSTKTKNLGKIIFKDQIVIRNHLSSDLSAIKELAGNAFAHNRFYNDKRLPPSRSNLLYKKWAENSCNGKADKVIIAESKGVFSGFVFCNIDALTKDISKYKFGYIDLIAVASKFRGRGIGTELVKAAANWFKTRVDIIEVRTQITNIPTIISHQRVGFKINSQGIVLPSGITFHKWI